MGRKPLWKSFQITDGGDMGRLESAWASSYKAFGKNKTMEFLRGYGDIETNLSYDQLGMLFRHAGVAFPRDMVTDTMPLEERAKEWEPE